MTREQRDEAIAQIKNSDAFLPIKARRIEEIMKEYDSPDNPDSIEAAKDLARRVSPQLLEMMESN